MPEKETVKDFDFYFDRAAQLIDRDKDDRQTLAAMDRIANLEYKLPSALQQMDWVRMYKQVHPYLAIQGAARLFSLSTERLIIEPITIVQSLGGGYDDQNTVAKQTANNWETALKWTLERATRRQTKNGLKHEVMEHAFKYDEICAEIEFLPVSEKADAALKKNTNRKQAAKRYGDFVLHLRNPKEVHATYSDYMLEEVLHVTLQSPQTVVRNWGAAAKKIQSLIDDDRAAETYVVFSYVSYEGRCVWAFPGDSEDKIDGMRADSKEVVKLLKPTELDHPFIPWVCAGHRTRRPLLLPIYLAELWVNANIQATLLQSETVAQAAQPTLAIEGPAASDTDVDYTDPSKRINIDTPGTTARKLPADGLDPAKAELYRMIVSEMKEATISGILISAEPAPGETFSGYLQRLGNAANSLGTWRALAESFYSGVYETMLLWAHYAGKDIEGYDTNQKSKAFGKKYTIDSEDIKPECIHLNAELPPNLPIDKQSQINSANMLIEMGMSREYTYGELGVDDPQSMMRDAMLEQMVQAHLQGVLQRIQMEASGELEQMAQQMAAQMHEQMMAEQAAQQEQAMQQQGGPPGGPPEAQGPMGAMANPSQQMTPGLPGVGGQGVNPAMGGLPPEMMAGGAGTFEQQRGMSRQGGAV